VAWSGKCLDVVLDRRKTPSDQGVEE
jgi:hypothetical protein